MVGKSTFGRSLTGSSWYAKMPKIRMAAMTSVVMMGRLMKRSEMLTVRLRPGPWQRCSSLGWHACLHDHFRIRSHAQLAVHNHLLAGLQSLRNQGQALIRPYCSYGSRFSRAVGPDDIDVFALLSALNSLRRDDDGILLRRELQCNVYKLSRPQSSILVLEKWLSA